MAWIPLSRINLPKNAEGKQIEAPTPTSLYSSKQKLYDRFEELMSSPEVTHPSEESVDKRTEERVLHNSQVESALAITIDIIDLYDRINAELPDLYNGTGGKFGGIDAVSKMNQTKSQKFTKFYRRPIETAIPEGFLYPLVYAYSALLEKNPDGTLFWSIAPNEFFEKHMPTLVKNYRETSMQMLGRDPQKVGKEAGSYTNLFNYATLAKLQG